MELIGLHIDEDNEVKINKTETSFIGLYRPPPPSPEIILTKEEAEARGLMDDIPEEKNLWNKIFHKGRKIISYCVVDGDRVLVSVKDD